MSKSRKRSRGVVPQVVPGVQRVTQWARDMDGYTAEAMLGEGARGLSPIIDVLRGLGDESAGMRVREPRVLQDGEITAMMRDGIGRRVASIKVIQALAPGHDIEFLGLAPDVAQQLLLDATEVWRRLDMDTHVVDLGVRAQAYGKAKLCNTWVSDAGVSDLYLPIKDLAWDRIRWVSVWDRRDYRVRALAPSTNTHYRQNSGATWLDLYPYQPPLEYDRQYSGLAGRTADPIAVVVHPSRYIQLTTTQGFSIFQDCAIYIANLLSAASGASTLMQRAGACVMEIDEWETQSLAGGNAARDKLQAQMAALSAVSVLITPKGEKATWPNISTSGIDGGLYAIAYLLSAATGIPMTILLGTSPGAFQSGEAQIKQWHQELDSTRKWLEPALRFAWDLCIAEVTGGYTGAYAIKWHPYETPDPKDALATQRIAFDLAADAVSKGFLSLDGALAGLSATGALGFDFAAAFATGKPKGSDDIVENVDASVYASTLDALFKYYAPGVPPPEALAAVISAVVKPLSSVVGTAFQPRTDLVVADPADAAAEGVNVPGVTASGVPVSGGGVSGAGVAGEETGADESADPDTEIQPTQPGQPLTPADVAAEPWIPASAAGEHYALSSQSLASLRTPTPGIMPGPGQLAWLQNPRSGHVRYRQSDLVRAMLGGRAGAAPVLADPTDEANAADGKPMEGWPLGGVAWRMIRQSDETGTSGTGIVVRGLVLCDGSVVSWWCSPGLPPRPHVDSCWQDFYVIHIGQHPSNGTIVEQLCAVPGGGVDAGASWAPMEWVEIRSLENGPQAQAQAQENNNV